MLSNGSNYSVDIILISVFIHIKVPIFFSILAICPIVQDFSPSGGFQCVCIILFALCDKGVTTT